MAVDPQQQTGGGQTSFTPRQFSNGYPIQPTSIGSDPNSTIPAAQQTNLTSAIGTAGQYTFPVDLPTVHMNIIEASVNPIETGGGSLLGRMIGRKMYRLPIPQQITDPLRVIYNDGYSYAGAIGAIGTALANANGNRSAIPQFISAVGGVTQRALGYTINTYKGIAMEQPQFKQHNLVWKLSPKTANESIVIQRIITSMRTGMLPRNPTGATKIVLGFPHVFIPFFHPNVSYMYKFKPCVMTGLDVDFAGGNPQPGFYKTNYAPESVVINMSLLEMEYWLENDYATNIDANGIPNNDPFSAFNFYNFTGTTSANTTDPNSGDFGPVVPGG